VGLVLTSWMHTMGAAEALLTSGELACSLRYEDLVERKQALAQQMLHELGLQQLGPAAAAAATSAATSAIGDDEPDEDAVVPSEQLEKARRDSSAARQRLLDEAFTTQAHQGGNAHLAGRRIQARGADGRLLQTEPLYFPPEEVPDMRRFMALHDFLGTADPYCELPKTLTT
jgi:hypothetical protein